MRSCYCLCSHYSCCNSDDVVVANDTNQSDSSVNESSGNSDDSSSAELGSRENPKTEADYVSGNSGDPNPNYGDYYVLDGGLFRDDNEYLGGNIYIHKRR